MKKLVIFMMAVVCVSISGCDNKTPIDNNKPIQQTLRPSIKPSEQNNSPIGTTSMVTKNTPMASPVEKDIKPLNASDFIVSDGSNSIKLDTPFKSFKIDKPEEKIGNNYVGETTSGEYTYKTYMHKYADFDLYVSNLNYNLKNRNFDEYYITQITLKNSNFKTNRGITIGSKLENVYSCYGNGEKAVTDGKETLSYRLNDMELLFTIDENQKVKEVVLMIKAANG